MCLFLKANELSQIKLILLVIDWNKTIYQKFNLKWNKTWKIGFL